MKKVISVIAMLAILAGIMSTGPISASADNNIELKEALEIAKAAFNFDTTNYDFNSSYSETQYGKKLWYLNWYLKTGSGSSINITVDAANKEIVNMYQWENAPAPTNIIPKHTKEEALKVAEELASRLHPVKFKEARLIDEYRNNLFRPYNNDLYNFSFIRKINGIDFPDNFIRIEVDKNTLKVRSFNLDWDTVIPIPDSKKAISTEAAKKIYEEELGIELAYQLIYPDMNKDPELILVYNQKYSDRPIDAITGEIVTQPYYNAMKEMAAGGGGFYDQAGYVPTPQEQKVIDNAEKYISREKAVEILKKYVPVDSSYKMNDSSLYGGQKMEDAAWSFSWSFNDKEKNTYSYIYGTVDAVTGEVKSFSISSSENEFKSNGVPKYTKEQCRKIAEDFLKNIQPAKFSTSEYREQNYEIYGDPKNIPSYSMNYIRRENGISVPFNNLSATVSTYTGKVTSFYMNWQNLDFPEAKGIISMSDAYGKLYKKHDLALKYARMHNYERFNESTVIKLIYMLDDYYGMIDAKSGQFIDYNGNPVKDDNKITFTDIDGHKYENDIKLLAELGIIDSDESKFDPDSKISQKYFVKLLMKATQPDYYPIPYAASDSEYDRYYDMAIMQNILAKKDKNPEASVTRMEASKMTIKALGVGFVADLGSIFNLNFSDASNITSENKGYAAIATALGIVDVTDGSFGPNHELTKAEAANLLIGYLKVEKTPKDSQVLEIQAVMPIAK